MLINKKIKHLIQATARKMFKLDFGSEKELQQELLERYLLTKSREELVKLG